MTFLHFLYILILLVCSVRFDLLAGVNKDEGAIAVILSITMLNMSDPEAGVSMEVASKILQENCEMLTPLSVQLCVKFLVDTYGLDQLENDIERGHRIGDVVGMFSTNGIIIYYIIYYIFTLFPIDFETIKAFKNL